LQEHFSLFQYFRDKITSELEKWLKTLTQLIIIHIHF
jgi:hypothetical protein